MHPPIHTMIASSSIRLEQERAARLEDLLAEHHTVIRRIRDELKEGSGIEVAARIAPDVDMLLAELRRGSSWEVSLDEMFRSDRPELLDVDWVPAAGKRIGMRLLDRYNRVVGSYEVFRESVMRALAGAPSAHVHDLAAGTGGFGVWLHQHPPRGCTLRVSSSDIDAGYVSIGERRARRKGIAIEFEVRDALSLAQVRGVDLYLCTQATHHLGPARVVALIAGAIRSAPRGVLIIDAYRSLGVAMSASAFAGALFPFAPFVHDTFQSVRRGFHAVELDLLARLAGAKHVEAKNLPPAWCEVHAYGDRD